MASKSEFLAVAKSYEDALNSYDVMLQSYAPFYKKLQNEDPCAAGFGDKLAELDREAESFNVYVTSTLIPAKSAYESALGSLGFFDKRNSEVTSQVQTVSSLFRSVQATKSTVTKAGRDELRTKLNACPAIKDPDAPVSDDQKKDPEQDTKPDDNSLAGKTGDDDQGNPNADAAKNDNPPDSADKTDSVTPKTTAGNADTPDAKVNSPGTSRPGKRPYNPLSKFSSHTYNITLYMVTPDGYNLFVNGGKKTLRQTDGSNYNGVYIVAQSGGINNNIDNRPPGMTMDYYIDNLKIKTNTTGKGTTDVSNNISYSFNIYEPNGFSFVNKLTQAAKVLLSNSKLKGVSGSGKPNPVRQFFILGISFTGYNSDGSVAKANEIFESDTFTTSDGGAVFERFYDIAITELKFNLDGNMVNYSIKASQHNNNIAMGTKNGALLDRTVARGNTVKEALLGVGGFIPFVNEQQKKLYDAGKIEIPIVYDLVFVNDAEKISEKIMTAKLISKTEIETIYRNKLGQIPMTALRKITEVTEAVAVKATVEGEEYKELTFEPNVMISAVIKKIIQSSTYLADALIAVNRAQEEPPTPNNDSIEESPYNPNPNQLHWYSLGSKIEVLGRDEKRNDYVHKITYIISPYKTPITTSIQAGSVSDYYGPHKRYDYWFTGLNTEVLKYSQAMNVAWYLAETGGNKDAKPAEQGAPVNPGQRTEGDKQGAIGTSLDTQNSYLNSLYSPGDWVKAKIEILGDPDYLMYDSPGDLNEVYSAFYADKKSFTINPSGGQVFIEIDFKEAMDYNHDINGNLANDGNYDDTGLMTLNNSIMLWSYPPEIAKKVKGISYIVVTVDSTFSKGKFTQVLDLNINTFPNVKTSSKTAAEREREENSREIASLEARYKKPAEDGNSSSNTNNQDSSSGGGSDAETDVNTTPMTNTGVVDDDGSNARDQLLSRQAVKVVSDNTREESISDQLARLGLGGP